MTFCLFNCVRASSPGVPLLLSWVMLVMQWRKNTCSHLFSFLLKKKSVLSSDSISWRPSSLMPPADDGIHSDSLILILMFMRESFLPVGTKVFDFDSYDCPLIWSEWNFLVYFRCFKWGWSCCVLPTGHHHDHQSPLPSARITGPDGRLGLTFISPACH